MQQSTQCLLCSKHALVEFLNLGKQPLANKYPYEKDFATEDLFPLSVHFCKNCKNFQLGTIVSRARMFEDYYYLSSVNPGLVRHFNDMAKTLAKERFVVDIGSNDGILLKPLKALGVETIGVDPSINVSKIANEQGLTTITAFFDEQVAEHIVQDYGKPTAVVASSIFTHLENPHAFIQGVKKLMDEHGSFIIEVEYIGDILKDIKFERFYLDRIFYYSLTSLRDLFALYDMVITNVEKIAPHGGSLRVTVKNASTKQKSSMAVIDLLKEEEQTLSLVALEQFRQKVDQYINDFRNKLVEYKKAHIKVAGYGAPARVSTICNYGKIDSSLISFLIDDSPLKQNRYSPGTHIPIFPKEHLENNKVNVLVVFAYEYFDDIKQKTKHGKYTYMTAIPPQEIK
ncbi:MAG: class I SAM-dependent methyltransferase [Nanoarchaeota archaeon]